MSNNQKSSKRGGIYWTPEKAYISVTEILKVIDKPNLRYWFGKEVYLAMVKDPSMSQQAALAAPYKKTEAAMSRGTTVHSIVESYKKIGEKIEVAEEFDGYTKAFYKWVEDENPSILVQERTIYSNTHGYAGTLDMLAAINHSELPYVIDVKTGKDIYPESFLQTAAYQQCLTEEGTETMGVGTLLIMENGDYKWQIS